MKVNIVRRKFVTQVQADELRKTKYAEFTPTGAQTYDILRDGWLDWYIVPDDDPRVGTIDEVTETSQDGADA